MERLQLLILCSLAFGSIGIFSNLLDGVNVATLAFIRAGISVIVFWLMFRKSIRPPKEMKVWAAYAISGICIATAFVLYLESFRFASVADVVLIGFLDPMFVMLLSGKILKEKFTIYSLTAMFYAMLGILALVSGPDWAGRGEAGLVLAALAVLAGGTTTLLTRWEEKSRQPLGAVLFFPFAFSAILLAIPGISGIGQLASGGDETLLLAIGLGVATAMGYVWYDSMMLKFGAHITDLATRVGITASGTAMSVVFLSQEISPGWWVSAGFFIMSAILICHEANLGKIPFIRRHHGHTH